MRLEVEVFNKGDAGKCDVVGCHNSAEFGFYSKKATQYICNYHAGPCIKRMAKEG